MIESLCYSLKVGSVKTDQMLSVWLGGKKYVLSIWEDEGRGEGKETRMLLIAVQTRLPIITKL